MGIVYPKETYSVYALCEPDTGEVRYIGQTAYPKMRFYNHMGKCPTRGSTACNHWLETLSAQGKRPRMLILEQLTDYGEAKKREHYWIRRYRTMGARVLNLYPLHGFCSWLSPLPAWEQERQEVGA